ncbi:MAG: toll/interleukin-1 receptor domain-containing protein, partial [Chitinophagaceae bacterium]
DKYGAEAKYVLMIISKDFVRKYWTNEEKKIATALNHEKEPYIISVRVDDTHLDGFKDFDYMLWENNPEDIAEMVVRKLEIRKQIKTKRRIKLTISISICFGALLFLYYILPFYSKINHKRELSGTITMNGRPVPALAVYTSFATDTTDSYGRYKISLDNCPECVPGYPVKIYTINTEAGSSQQEYTINKDYKFDFTISRGDIVINGMVESVGVSNTALQEIEVSVVAEGIEVQPVKTDRSGIFRLPVSRGLLTNTNAIRLQVHDPAGRYKPLRLEPDFFNITSFAVIKMQQSEAVKIAVEGYTPTSICIDKGDIVNIEADGNIRVGANIGNADPDGRNSGMLGMSLEQYNIVRNLNHAALLYKLDGDANWKLAGKRKRFVATHNGCIEFQVNDNTQSDNYGSYTVEVSVQRQ